jgi:hypothetical protein
VDVEDVVALGAAAWQIGQCPCKFENCIACDGARVLDTRRVSLYIIINQGDPMKFLILVLSAALTSAAYAGPKCTTEPKDKWQDQKAFQKSLEDQGYKIKVFKVTKGDCYEIYGWNKDGKKVEIYFDPVTAEKKKEVIN